jgi:hypothetical protein
VREGTPSYLAEVLRHPGALEGEAKPPTVLFLDIQDSMVLAGHLGVEAWHALLDRFFQIATGAIRRSDGTVNQTPASPTGSVRPRRSSRITGRPRGELRRHDAGIASRSSRSRVCSRSANRSEGRTGE